VRPVSWAAEEREDLVPKPALGDRQFVAGPEGFIFAIRQSAAKGPESSRPCRFVSARKTDSGLQPRQN